MYIGTINTLISRIDLMVITEGGRNKEICLNYWVRRLASTLIPQM